MWIVVDCLANRYLVVVIVVGFFGRFSSFTQLNPF